MKAVKNSFFVFVVFVLRSSLSMESLTTWQIALLVYSFR